MPRWDFTKARVGHIPKLLTEVDFFEYLDGAVDLPFPHLPARARRYRLDAVICHQGGSRLSGTLHRSLVVVLDLLCSLRHLGFVLRWFVLRALHYPGTVRRKWGAQLDAHQ